MHMFGADILFPYLFGTKAVDVVNGRTRLRRRSVPSTPTTWASHMVS